MAFFVIIFLKRVWFLLFFTAIKTVLKQGNLNPEIEEKLLTLQRYQEKQMKGEPFDASNFSSSSQNSRNVHSPDDDMFDDNNSRTSHTRPYRKRRENNDDDDEEWCIDTPKKRYNKEGKKGKDREYMPEYRKPSKHSNDTSDDQQENRHIIVKTETSSADSIKKNIIINYNKTSSAVSSSAFSANSSNVPIVGSPDSKDIKNIVKREIRLKAAKMTQHHELTPHQDTVRQTKLHVSFDFGFWIFGSRRSEEFLINFWF